MHLVWDMAAMQGDQVARLGNPWRTRSGERRRGQVLANPTPGLEHLAVLMPASSCGNRPASALFKPHLSHLETLMNLWTRPTG